MDALLFFSENSSRGTGAPMLSKTWLSLLCSFGGKALVNFGLGDVI